MLARCARCQGTFQADRFGVQTCPHCGGEILLADPNVSAASPDAGAPPPPPPPPPPAAVPPPPSAAPASELPPPPPPPAGGYGPPPGGFGPPPGGFSGPPPPFGQGGARPAGPELPSPFADRAKVGFLRAYFQTWKLAAVEPAGFFRRVRIDQTGSAILFGVIASTLGGWAQAFWASMTAASTRAQMADLADKIPPEMAGMLETFKSYTELATSPTALLSQVVFAPLAAVVGIFLSAAVFHGLLLLVRGANRGFDATLTVVGYASGVSLLQVIPECGALVVPIWAAVVLIIGLGEAHRCGTGKGAAAVLLPLLLLCACLCAVAFIAIGASGLGAVTGGLPKGINL